MKKFVSIILALLMLATLSSAVYAEGGKIGVSMPTQSLQRWNQDGANMQAQLEAKGYTVNLQYANDDVATQVSQIENMLLDGVGFSLSQQSTAARSAQFSQTRKPRALQL